MAFRACLATRRATWARGARKQKARRLPRGSRRVVKGSLRLWRSTATVKAEAAGEQTEDDQDDPDQGVAEYERNNPENDQQSASTEVHPAPPFLRIPIALPTIGPLGVSCEESELRDRKSTRLNSSHSQISYAVFCLKKKKNSNNAVYTQP